MALLVPPAAAPLAQDVFAYPSKGQSQEQQDKDNFECHKWAKEQSGFDPMKTQQASSPPPREKSTGPGALGGAAMGAGAGLVGGAIAGKPGTGALVGAGAGGLIGGMHSRSRKKQNRQAREDYERQQASQQQQGRNAFNRAFSACMSSRGYTIQ